MIFEKPSNLFSHASKTPNFFNDYLLFFTKIQLNILFRFLEVDILKK